MNFHLYSFGINRNHYEYLPLVVGWYKPETSLATVDFPEPLPPTKAKMGEKILVIKAFRIISGCIEYYSL